LAARTYNVRRDVACYVSTNNIFAGGEDESYFANPGDAGIESCRR
jgi:hypothetical protein